MRETGVDRREFLKAIAMAAAAVGLPATAAAEIAAAAAKGLKPSVIWLHAQELNETRRRRGEQVLLAAADDIFSAFEDQVLPVDTRDGVVEDTVRGTGHCVHADESLQVNDLTAPRAASDSTRSPIIAAASRRSQSCATWPGVWSG